ncbi:MAG: transposase [Bacteroidales bacterium]|nr:transposase [Bacteroidales bacterium]
MKTKNDPHIIARNKKLIQRYLFWTEIKRRRTDDVLKILEWEEFFISQQSIMLILRKNSALLEEESKKIMKNMKNQK